MISHLAEEVLPGHPDRIADAIAESLVDLAVSRDPEALVGVEVAVFGRFVCITGRMAANPRLDFCISDVVREAYSRCGYRGRWEISPQVEARALQVNLLSPEERAARALADDQNIVAGYAWNSLETGYLPPAVHIARLIRRGLIALCGQHPDMIGPDGKIMVHLEQKKSRLTWNGCNISLQHAPELGYERIFRLILPIIHTIKRVEKWSDEKLRVNGMGDFSTGGPFSDNGLSGKKLVVDHYGPGVPIGGGALCGKDPHKVDRVGALRARQVAVRLVQSTGAREALVYLGYLPGLSTPSILSARVDGEEWSEARIRQSVDVPDLSIEGSFRDLDLGSEKWLEVLLKGYFGNKWRWEA